MLGETTFVRFAECSGHVCSRPVRQEVDEGVARLSSSAERRWRTCLSLFAHGRGFTTLTYTEALYKKHDAILRE